MVVDTNAAQSRRLFERASKVMPRGNSRHSVFYVPHPVYCVSGDGYHVIDADGVVRIDFLNNYSSMIHGHAHPKVQAALWAQAAKVIAVGLPTETEIELAELLCERVASVEQVRFTNSGTEAVMMAIKAARAFTGRSRIAKFEGCYHGTYDSVEVSQAPAPDAWGPAEEPHSVALSRGTPQWALHETLVLPFNDVVATANILYKHRDSIAGIIIDSTPAHLGYLQISTEMLRILRTFADAHGALLIMDEVYSLRLDYHGAQHRFGIRPDITVMGKIIGGGLPIGAVGGSRAVMDVFDPLPNGPAVFHGGTYNANPLSMATGLASMRELSIEAYAQLEHNGDYLRRSLNALAIRADIEFIVEGVGSLVSITFGSGPIRNYRDRAVLKDHRRRLTQLHRGMLDEGILLAPQGLAVLSTPMRKPQLDAFVHAMEAVLSRMADSESPDY
jgi:glutamate-1-semialdehyde 2,1-aminomutase